jgi:hypothetical protein
VAGQLPHEGAHLWLRRQDYQSGSDTPSLRRGYTALVLSVALATVYSFGGVLVIHRQLHHVIHRQLHHPVVIRHVLRTSVRLVAFQHLHLHHAAMPYAEWFVQSFPVLSAVALIYGIAMILCLAILWGGTTPEDRACLQELVHTCGLNPLAPYVLQEDKASREPDQNRLPPIAG